MITAEQQVERLKYLGSSDAAAALGLSRWCSPLELWATKTGAIPQKDLSDFLPAEVGNELEPFVVRKFEKATGKKTKLAPETIIHPNHAFIAANLDRWVIEEDGRRVPLEVKTASAWKKKEWSEELVPQEYTIQVLHQLAVTGSPYAYLAVLIGNSDFQYSIIQRDPQVCSDIIKKEVDFWTRFVEPKVMPLQITKQDAETLYTLFPIGDEGECVELGDEANRVIENLDASKADMRVLEGNIDRMENELKALLKDKESGKTDKYIVSWKNQITKRLDSGRLKVERPVIYSEFVKQTGSRVLRYKEIKGE